MLRDAARLRIHTAATRDAIKTHLGCPRRASPATHALPLHAHCKQFAGLARSASACTGAGAGAHHRGQVPGCPARILDVSQEFAQCQCSTCAQVKRETKQPSWKASRHTGHAGSQVLSARVRVLCLEASTSAGGCQISRGKYGAISVPRMICDSSMVSYLRVPSSASESATTGASGCSRRSIRPGIAPPRRLVAAEGMAGGFGQVQLKFDDPELVKRTGEGSRFRMCTARGELQHTGFREGQSQKHVLRLRTVAVRVRLLSDGRKFTCNAAKRGASDVVTIIRS